MEKLFWKSCQSLLLFSMSRACDASCNKFSVTVTATVGSAVVIFMVPDLFLEDQEPRAGKKR